MSHRPIDIHHADLASANIIFFVASFCFNKTEWQQDRTNGGSILGRRFRNLCEQGEERTLEGVAVGGGKRGIREACGGRARQGVCRVVDQWWSSREIIVMPVSIIVLKEGKQNATHPMDPMSTFLSHWNWRYAYLYTLLEMCAICRAQ